MRPRKDKRRADLISDSSTRMISHDDKPSGNEAWERCSCCGGSGKVWATSTDSTFAKGYQQDALSRAYKVDCSCCDGRGRVEVRPLSHCKRLKGAVTSPQLGPTECACCSKNSWDNRTLLAPVIVILTHPSATRFIGLIVELWWHSVVTLLPVNERTQNLGSSR